MTDDCVTAFLADDTETVRLAAERDGRLVGIAALVPAGNELRACYVAPEAARMGVGGALVRALEQAERLRGLVGLSLTASLNAEPFYGALGYAAEKRVTHTLSAGVPMTAVRMTRSRQRFRRRLRRREL